MYGAETQESIENVALDERLKADESGKLLDRLIDELRIAADEITRSLEDNPPAADVPVLRGLLGAVGLGESIVMEMWTTFHGTRSFSASANGKRFASETSK